MGRSAGIFRRLKVNLNKTKLLVTGKKAEVMESGSYPCAVCGQGVARNSILCNTSGKWCHKRCSGLRSLNVTNFQCPKCSNPAGGSDVDDSLIVRDGVIEEVTHFCYLGDVLDRDGGAERAVRARIACGWAKWRELSSLFNNRGIPLQHRARVYEACVRSVVLYGSECWALTKKLEDLIIKSDRRMLRYLAGVSLRDRVASEEVLRRCGLKSIVSIMNRKQLGWFGHVARRAEYEQLGRIGSVEAPGRAPRGRPKKTWKGCVEDLLRNTGVAEEEAMDRSRWRDVVQRLTSSR